jgi:hypothetical protein
MFCAISRNKSKTCFLLIVHINNDLSTANLSGKSLEVNTSLKQDSPPLECFFTSMFGMAYRPHHTTPWHLKFAQYRKK